jgi:hypothetical protein
MKVEMIRAIGIAVVMGFMVSSLAAHEKQWDPATAASDARRDIAQHRIRFCYVGGYAPNPVGTPVEAYEIVSRYPHIAVGNQGCEFTEHQSVEHEYARLYNQEMWRYVSRNLSESKTRR